MPSKKRRMWINHERFLKSLPSLIQAAEEGDLNAQHDLAAFYATDDLSGLKNVAEAIKWYTIAAEHGHVESQYDLGFMLILGEGTERNVPTGLRWMEQSAVNGYIYATSVLSDTYSKGLYGIAPDAEKAAYWNEQINSLKNSS